MKKGLNNVLKLAAISCLALCVLALGACAQQQQTQAPDNSNTETNALVIYAEDGDYLFVDTETETLFFPELTNATITNSSGNKVSRENLAVGDIVTVTGDGTMTMSYPAIYPNITKVKIISRGNMDDVKQYSDIIDMLYPPMNENDIPIGWLFYETSVGNITLALDAYNYKGFAITTPNTTDTNSNAAGADEQATPTEQSLDGSYVNESGFILEGVADARFKDRTDATVVLSQDFQTVTVERRPVNEATGGRMRVDLGAQQQTVGAAVVGNGEFMLTIEPGYVYIVNAIFANGEAHYAFTTLDY